MKKIRESLYGRKTFLGCILVGMAGLTWPIHLYYPPIADVAVGMALVGLALAVYGIYNRISYVFYQVGEDGRPDLKRSKIKKAMLR